MADAHRQKLVVSFSWHRSQRSFVRGRHLIFVQHLKPFRNGKMNWKSSLLTMCDRLFETTSNDDTVRTLTHTLMLIHTHTHTLADRLTSIHLLSVSLSLFFSLFVFCLSLSLCVSLSLFFSIFVFCLSLSLSTLTQLLTKLTHSRIHLLKTNGQKLSEIHKKKKKKYS